MTEPTLGVAIAGGLSTRFGSPKALARVAGRRVIDRVADALRDALGHDDIVCIVNDATLAAQIGLPARADRVAGSGPLAGLHAGLHWALGEQRDGILAVGCDMPFLSGPLLRELLGMRGSADAVLPASEGPRGVEPLCAWYGTSCLPALEAALARGDRRMIGFHADVRIETLPLARVRSHGEPAVLFMNLNTPADHERAERIAAAATQ